jgi:hypothetical protein
MMLLAATLQQLHQYATVASLRCAPAAEGLALKLGQLRHEARAGVQIFAVLTDNRLAVAVLPIS